MLHGHLEHSNAREQSICYRGSELTGIHMSLSKRNLAGLSVRSASGKWNSGALEYAFLILIACNLS